MSASGDDIAAATPRWLDREAYPFRSRHFAVPAGRMHYVDEGEGEAVVMVHGTPTWSFLYRHLIACLSPRYRCIAPDHIGFGLSDKPEAWSYRPEDHARNLETLIDHLSLSRVTLVVHDFGGPIGLSYAVARPENVARLILFNTWMWPLDGEPTVRRMSGLFGTAFGRFLYTRANFSPRVMIPAAFGDKSKLTPSVRRHYLAPFPEPSHRVGPWVLARELIGSSEWYDSLWRRRKAILNLPALLVWGMKDPAFGPRYLKRWVEAFSNAEVRIFRDAGHFVPEEVGPELCPLVEAFLRGQNVAAGS